MSRTWKHGWKAKQLYFEDYEYEHWKWYSSEPKYWRKMVKHRPQRQKCRQLAIKVLRGEVEQLWPLDKKPRIWYW